MFSAVFDTEKSVSVLDRSESLSKGAHTHCKGFFKERSGCLYAEWTSDYDEDTVMGHHIFLS